MKKIALIGSTGSIGRQVIEVVKAHPDEYKIVAIVAAENRTLFEKQKAELNPKLCALACDDAEAAKDAAAFAEADIVFNAAGGFAGLNYSLTAINAGKPLALANKETLVCGGEFINGLARKKGVEIIPVDSEHSAIWQCMNFDKATKVRRLIITASGGAFRGYSPEKLKSVTKEQALAHPTWKMGKKITVDSATLMNKGYEVIEAHMLYGTPYSEIEAVIQPQSIIHSLVEFADGACLAQMSYPTMEIPIQLALSYPERLHTSVNPMDFTRAFSLGFESLEKGAYPCFDLAVACGEAGGTLPCALNAADEEAVKAFIEGRIAFTDIYRVADGVIQSAERRQVKDFDLLTEVDRAARLKAQKIIKRL
ncbi:MAG: 1-deoxy-D-xylulose-5-phosphate reductoisomerase [Clostridia bacterium]|nr:1-deoxy-D-xylulose-5-phosphate reductoisomerase [Clostridia bacterium]